MTLRLYDSATRAVRDFEPLEPGKVGIYLCGATVQGEPHVGHLRSVIAFDVLVRWLRRSGLDVTMIRNVTDIDDKILAKSAEAGVPWWAWAYRHERAFSDAYDAVGNLPPTYEPRATGHVVEMIELMQRLVDRGNAYRGKDGNVWFDVRSLADYGSLTRQKLENMSTLEEESSDKADPHDFALWKGLKPGDPETASWETPFGRGRPGWHLECSAMAYRYLGETFDIHGGGIDLRFPHHENEQAQSHAAGYGFARYWLHNAWVTAGGEKMSKSLGNYLTAAEALGRVPAVVLRYALASVHYRSSVEFTEATLAEARVTWERIAGFVTRAAELTGPVGDDGAARLADVVLPIAFVEAMDDDLNVSAALAVLHEHIRLGNTALSSGEAGDAAAELSAVRGMLDVLGLDPLAEPWVGEASATPLRGAVDVLVEGVLADRSAARAAKDWARADALRDQLAAAGVVVEDSPSGARWTIKGT
ncbi:cysteinyl-tRNA synthetase [Beutenbergia cavernae DSM 12333]|uniref:Cysteine--tRNA ligase n=1 Tax=Beutenbergia cavernae (strain ATCC BAA-8 / DSM 12333 / CCUG 43141 / JCM 11478 / NBRC 16432 / NCIMB 13614 / HKI 0122) TaxID=471853 RepID=SYC_BEUC1|nr:cysteine--tRNA ligase [Beutenbergia cavernae]C5BYT3.1 RecName: Full=Cysteine--tRNA ligase; AltName: Full=Cysteinyl-tRNA synthetase; Short=CysRS [Beutenbergia cavernae DSM 12333]ACQ79041.1 cysteinyl-tRNA synthetase [Beutenbergia cavernae DSM 12333]